jgi:hypothetical protein
MCRVAGYGPEYRGSIHCGSLNADTPWVEMHIPPGRFTPVLFTHNSLVKLDEVLIRSFGVIRMAVVVKLNGIG